MVKVVPSIEKNVGAHRLELHYEWGIVEHDQIDTVPLRGLHAGSNERDLVVCGVPTVGINDNAEIKVAAVSFATGRDGPEDVGRPHGGVAGKDLSEPTLNGLGKHNGGASETKGSLSI